MTDICYRALRNQSEQVHCRCAQSKSCCYCLDVEKKNRKKKTATTARTCLFHCAFKRDLESKDDANATLRKHVSLPRGARGGKGRDLGIRRHTLLNKNRKITGKESVTLTAVSPSRSVYGNGGRCLLSDLNSAQSCRIRKEAIRYRM